MRICGDVSSSRCSAARRLWPLAARAQQPDRMRRIGVLMSVEENGPEGKTQLSQFTQGLAESGWTDGRNLRMEVRWGGGDVNRTTDFRERVGRPTARRDFRRKELRGLRRCNGKPARSRSYSWLLPIRLARNLWQAFLGLEETSQGLSIQKP